jgi:hypothetical protein
MVGALCAEEASADYSKSQEQILSKESGYTSPSKKHLELMRKMEIRCGGMQLSLKCPMYESLLKKYDGELTQDGYKFVSTHMALDVKLGENYRRQARLVADGHKTDTPTSTITYSSVVSRDSVRIALTIAPLNDLNIFACDIQNAYLTAPCREKLYTVV